MIKEKRIEKNRIEEKRIEEKMVKEMMIDILMLVMKKLNKSTIIFNSSGPNMGLTMMIAAIGAKQLEESFVDMSAETAVNRTIAKTLT